MIVLAAIGLFVRRFSLFWGNATVVSALALLYLVSTSLVAGWLHRGLTVYPALEEADLHSSRAEAIVVLAGGRLYDQPEYDGDTVSSSTLQRLRYAAWLRRRTALPVYVSGGQLPGDAAPIAALMRDVLQKEFIVEVNRVEGQSKTTFENADYSARLLKQAGIHTIYLVTHASHMRRSVEAFEHFDIRVVPAPTVFLTSTEHRFPLMRLLPSAYALHMSFDALHEYMGLLWYRIRYF
jgi:uncharacterized SAM-binding protein YcdF (DUF218 family)